MDDLERLEVAKSLAKSACADLTHILNLHDKAKTDPAEDEGYHEWIMGRLLIVESDLNTATIAIRNIRSHCRAATPRDFRTPRGADSK